MVIEWCPRVVKSSTFSVVLPRARGNSTKRLPGRFRWLRTSLPGARSELLFAARWAGRRAGERRRSGLRFEARRLLRRAVVTVKELRVRFLRSAGLPLSG